MLKITPPSTASDKRTKSYGFVEAVKKFPTNFSAKELEHILPKIGKRQFGSLKSVFICLSDDLKRSSTRSVDDDAADELDTTIRQSDEVQGSRSEERSGSRSGEGSGSRSGRGSVSAT
jgi:hypothetical protein